MTTYKYLCAALVLLLAMGTSACSTQEKFNASLDGRPALQLGEYRIGPEDELYISVWKNETLSRTVPVRPDGMISLPLLNDVQAAGLTPNELRDVLRKKLASYVAGPEVSVIVQAVRSFKVSVLGEVRRPGTFEISGRSTVLDALARAEGLNDFASRSRIVILRSEGETTKRVSFNYNRAISEDREQENFYLRPGDIVVVP